MKSWWLCVLPMLVASPAWALTQPNGTPIPSQMGCNGGKPTGLAAVFACVCDQPGVCNIGAPCPNESTCDNGQHAQCETTLWHAFNDNTCIPSQSSGLNPQQEARTTPETFRPTCPLTFTMVTRGTAMFHDIFGWYNVTGSAPQLSELHPMLDCNAPQGTAVVLDIQNDPSYAGGEIGFFLATPEDAQHGGSCAGGDCCATIDRVVAGQGHVFYSQRGFNPDAQGAQSVIHLLIFDSKIASHKFYFAWEDIFGGANTDFSDIVTSVSGVECSGGGVLCSTGQQGICAQGISACGDDGALACTPLHSAEPEKCDALDNDCNGLIDDNATCPALQVCHQGACVPKCQSGEFSCPSNTVCEEQTGLCLSDGCVNVPCTEGKICRQGQCVTPCEGIVCPWGQQCFNDACVQPCANVSCPDGKTCLLGVCVDGCGSCSGPACEAPLRCNTQTGACHDPSCEPPCGAGTHCDQGTCKDNCDGVQCPPGQNCQAGVCQGQQGAGGGGLFDAGPTDSGSAGQAGTAGAAGSHSDASVGSVYDPDGSDDGGCGCRLAGSSGSKLPGAFALLGLVGLARTLLGKRKRP